MNAGCCRAQGIVALSPALELILVCNQNVTGVDESCLSAADPFTIELLNSTVGAPRRRWDGHAL